MQSDQLVSLQALQQAYRYGVADGLALAQLHPRVEPDTEMVLDHFRLLALKDGRHLVDDSGLDLGETRRWHVPSRTMVSADTIFFAVANRHTSFAASHYLTCVIF